MALPPADIKIITGDRTARSAEIMNLTFSRDQQEYILDFLLTVGIPVVPALKKNCGVNFFPSMTLSSNEKIVFTFSIEGL